MPSLTLIVQLGLVLAVFTMLLLSSAAMVYAIATNDPAGDASKVNVNVPDIAARVAEALAVDEKQLQLGRLAASPTSGNVYMSVNITEPKSAALVRIDAQGKVSKVALDNVKFSTCELPSPPKDTAAAGRRSSGCRRRPGSG